MTKKQKGENEPSKGTSQDRGPPCGAAEESAPRKTVAAELRELLKGATPEDVARAMLWYRRRPYERG